MNLSKKLAMLTMEAKMFSEIEDIEGLVFTRDRVKKLKSEKQEKDDPIPPEIFKEGVDRVLKKVNKLLENLNYKEIEVTKVKENYLFKDLTG
jgi:hypothetical protein